MNTLKAEFASQVRAIIKQPVKTKSCEAWCLSPLNRTTSCWRRHQHDRQLQNGARSGSTARQGQQLMAEIHALPIPVIGLFMALAWVVGWSWRWRATVRLY